MGSAATTPRLLQRDGESFTGLSGPAGPMVPIMRVAAVVTFVQQRGGGDFTGLSRARPGFSAWYVPAAASGRHPP